jgi:excisionase family DNA binding protein
MNSCIINEVSPQELKALIATAVQDELGQILSKFVPEATEPEELLTKQQAAKFLKVSHVTLNKLIKEGALPCRHLSNTIRFKKSEILKSLTLIRSQKYSRRIVEDST